MGQRRPMARGRPSRHVAAGAARRLALGALDRIGSEGAYANLVLPAMLEASDLDDRDRRFVTELVYGTTRMRRACDHLVDRFVAREVEPTVRNALRLGAYQLAFMDVPRHAAVGETVGIAPARARGFVNAILRRVADAPLEWPTPAHALSYPDWIVERLGADLGDEALPALEAMNLAPSVTHRADGYTQDLASQWVVDLVDVREGERVADLCAAPGGKATGMAGRGALVVAGDLTASRVGLITGNVTRTGADSVVTLVADGTSPALRPASLDRVLVDAPCSGIGVLRRRADARWRIQPGDVDRLAALQRRLVDAALPLLRPGGLLVYSVCTLTDVETLGIDEHLAATWPDLEPLAAPNEPWRPWGRGALLLPHAAGTDGMFLLRLQVPS